jgi:hypothetical protein
MDCYLDRAVDVVSNPRPLQPFEFDNWGSTVDMAYRQVFASLESTQKQIVLRLVREVASGVLLSALSGLDQFYIAEVKIALVGNGPNGQPMEVPVTSIETDLARLFVESGDELSKYAVQLADDLRSPPQV